MGVGSYLSPIVHNGNAREDSKGEGNTWKTEALAAHILNMAILEARVVVGSVRSPAASWSNASETVISSSPYCCMRCRNLPHSNI